MIDKTLCGNWSNCLQLKFFVKSIFSESLADICQNAIFWGSELTTIYVTKNLKNRKFLQFSHCVIETFYIFSNLSILLLVFPLLMSRRVLNLSRLFSTRLLYWRSTSVSIVSSLALSRFALSSWKTDIIEFNQIDYIPN